MKVSLVQTEIEAAVEAHIRSIFQVRDGMKITMDFSATRGPDGLTAAIDIVPETHLKPTMGEVAAAALALAATPEARAARAAPTPVPARELDRAPATRSVFQRAASAQPPAAEQDAQDEAGVEEEEHPSSQAKAGDEDGEEVPGETQEVTEAPAAPKASIFSGVRRVSNSKPVEEAA